MCVLCCVGISASSTVSCAGAKHGGLVEPRDTELDLSEADFAPTQHSVLLKSSCMANGSDLDSAALSDSACPPLSEHRAASNGMLGNQTTATCADAQNGEVGAAAVFVQHDAIGLPLCTENLAASNCHETVPARADISSQYDAEAADGLSTTCEDRSERRDVAGNLLQSADDSIPAADLSSAANASTPVSACGGPSDELSSCLGSDKNISCEESMAVSADHGNTVSIAKPLNGSSFTISEIEPVEQSVGRVQLDITGTQQVVLDESHDLPVPYESLMSSAAQGVREAPGEVQGQIEAEILQGESLTADTVEGLEVEKGQGVWEAQGEIQGQIEAEILQGESPTADNVEGLAVEEEQSQDVGARQTAAEEEESVRVVVDSCAVQSAVAGMDDVDGGFDEVDKTVSTSRHVLDHAADTAKASMDDVVGMDGGFDEVDKTVSTSCHMLNRSADTVRANMDDVGGMDGGFDEVDKTVFTYCRGLDHSADTVKASMDDVDVVDGGFDEVDKTVFTPCRALNHSASATVKNVDVVDAGTLCHVSGHLHEDVIDLTSSVAACSEIPQWVIADGTATCGIDHVERITTDDVARSRVEVKLGSCSDLLDVDNKDLNNAASGLESSLVTSVSETVDLNEGSICSATQLLHETGSGDAVAVIGNVPMQLGAQSAVDIDDRTWSLPGPKLSADIGGASSSEAKPADDADVPRDLPASGNKRRIDNLESLQEEVCEDAYLPHVSAAAAVAWPNGEPLSVNSGGGAHNVESCEKETDGDIVNSLPAVCVGAGIAVNAAPAADSERSPVEADHDVQVSGNLPDVGVDEISSEALPELPLPDSGLSALDSRNAEQDSCGLNNTVMLNTGPREPAGLVSGESLTVDTTPFSAHTSNNSTVAVEDNDGDRPYTGAVVEETQDHPTDDLPVLVRDRTEVEGPSAEGRSDLRRQSDEDAERWFEEKFAACEDFDVDEFVSSAWSEFCPDAMDSAPVVGNIRDEMQGQLPAAAAAASVSDYDYAAGECKATDVETAATWTHVENAAVAASAVDDSVHPSSGELSHFVGSEMDAAACYISSSAAQYDEPPAPGTILLLPQ